MASDAGPTPPRYSTERAAAAASADTSFASSTQGLLPPSSPPLASPSGEKLRQYRDDRGKYHPAGGEEDEEEANPADEAGNLLGRPSYEKSNPSSSHAGSHKTRPPFVPIRGVVAACLIVLALVFSSFFFAPSLHSLLPSSLSPSTARVTPEDLDKAEAAVDDLGADMLSHPRPEGPPGSITDTTIEWSSVAPSLSTVDSNAGAPSSTEGLYWNGTHWFNKTIIVVSLDGVRASYLDRGLTPHLVRLSEKGLKAESMKPVFPTLTFPNHWSLLTGLHPESHGIVANDFWCPDLGREFVYTDPFKSWDASWWGGLPIWAVAERQGVKAANLMWPGPPYLADRTRPTYWRAFENHYRWTRKLHHLLSWVDLDLASRPQLILSYLPEVDQVGHAYGPSDPRHSVDKALKGVDAFAGALWAGLEQRNLTGAVDVVFVSDHGMTSTANVRVVHLDELLGKEWYGKITHKEGWPSAGLRFEDDVDTDAVLQSLLKAAKEQEGFDVYTHETMPTKWHFSGNPRIAPIYVVPHHGWAISDTHEHLVTMKGKYSPAGNHGYNNDEPDMQAIFVAHGPFAERIKTQRRRALGAGRHESRWSLSRWSRDRRRSEKARQAQREELVRTIPPFPNLELFGLISKLLDLKDLPPTNSTPGFWEQYF